ncbi:hypothetical protein CM240_1135 [Clostridium bornimense]|uniref:Uncharacterized protein n=1 Tax=Clostridium bornimense TaxID=1216932 RepID=W6RXE3_9CLOT|nr:hypothetical protein [Clostridium bornimense]CDM68299.1 hypothetical protein CM240_1135 [Clostridium bornimense]
MRKVYLSRNKIIMVSLFILFNSIFILGFSTKYAKGTEFSSIKGYRGITGDVVLVVGEEFNENDVIALYNKTSDNSYSYINSYKISNEKCKVNEINNINNEIYYLVMPSTEKVPDTVDQRSEISKLEIRNDYDKPVLLNHKIDTTSIKNENEINEASVNDNENLKITFNISDGDNGAGVDDESIIVTFNDQYARKAKKNDSNEYEAVFSIGDIKNDSVKDGFLNGVFKIAYSDNVSNEGEIELIDINYKYESVGDSVKTQIKNLKCNSNNANKNNISKVNDTISIKLTMNKAVKLTEAKLLDKQATISKKTEKEFSKVWYITYTIEEIKDSVENIPLNIIYEDKNKTTFNETVKTGIEYYSPIVIEELLLDNTKKNDNGESILRDDDEVQLLIKTNNKVSIEGGIVSIGGNNVNVSNKSLNKWDIKTKFIGDKNLEGQYVDVIFKLKDLAGNILNIDKDKWNELINNEDYNVKLKYYSPLDFEDNIVKSNNSNNNLIGRNGDNIIWTFNTIRPVEIEEISVNGKTMDRDKVKNDKDNKNWIIEYKIEENTYLDQEDIKLSVIISDALGDKKTFSSNSIRYYGPIDISEVKFQSSNNKNGNLAINGDELLLELETNHSVKVLDNTTIANETNIDKKENNNSWIITYSNPTIDIEDNTKVPFEVNLSDDAGNTISIDETSIDSVIYYAPIVINNLKFSTDNEDDTKAKDNDVVEVTFNTTHPVNIMESTIASKDIEMKSDDGFHWRGEYRIQNGDIKDNEEITMKLEVNDVAGNEPVIRNQLDTTKIKYFAPIIVSDFSISSSNKENKYAKNGDVITINFTTNHKTYLSNSTIAGKNIKFTSNKDKTKWSGEYYVKNGDISDLDIVDFNITIEDEAANTSITKNVYDDDDYKITYYAPIKTDQSIESTGKNSGYAKNGDDIKIDIATNHEVEIQSALIFNRDIYDKTSGKSNKLYVKYTIPKKEKEAMEGEIPVEIIVKDIAGNTTKIESFNDIEKNRVIYDRTLPTIKLETSFDGFVNKDITYKVNLKDENIDLNGISIVNNGVDIVDSDIKLITVDKDKMVKEITLSEEGEYEINGSITDLAGNKCSEDLKIKLIIDKTKPNITSTKIDINKPMAFKKGFIISDYFNIEDKYIDEVICRLTDDNGTKEWNVDDPIEEDGKKTIYLMAKDMAKNVSNEFTYDIYIDGTAPRPLLIDNKSERTLEKGKNLLPFILNMKLNIDLEKLNMGNEDEDKFTKLQLLDGDNNVLVDFLKENEKYPYAIDKVGNYKLIVNAIDDVGNETGDLEYIFTIKESSVGIIARTCIISGIIIFIIGITIYFLRSRKNKLG